MIKVKVFRETDNPEADNYFNLFLSHPRCTLVHDYNNSDLVVLTGGVDINPHLYGQIPLETTWQSNLYRDREEQEIFKKCIQDKKPIVGICRGAQFLNVMNGGTLEQHVPEHQQAHNILYSDDWDTILSQKGDQGSELTKVLYALAGHHQCMRDCKRAKIIGASEFDNNPEIVFWPETRCLGHQPHPEWMPSHSVYRHYFYDSIFNLLGDSL